MPILLAVYDGHRESLTGLGLDIEESNRLYDSLVQSVASLVQCLRA
jgi:hypothetical protein